MAADSTLNSRLRVLVAKAFRAEKLYTSLRNTNSEAALGVGQVAEVANDIRAREWQKCHNRLRAVLNEILSFAPTSQIAVDVASARDVFATKAAESAAELERATAAVVEQMKRHEFGTVLKGTIELVRHKARAQANRAIAEELASALGSALPAQQLAPSLARMSSSTAFGAESPFDTGYVDADLVDTRERAVAGASSPGLGADLLAEIELAEENAQRSNVVPFHRPAAFAARYNRG